MDGSVGRTADRAGWSVVNDRAWRAKEDSRMPTDTIHATVTEREVQYG